MFLENNVEKSLSRPRVVIGYGSASKDLFVRATRFLNFTEDFGEEDVDEINSERDLLISFAYYFQRGVSSR